MNSVASTMHHTQQLTSETMDVTASTRWRRFLSRTDFSNTKAPFADFFSTLFE